MERALIRLFVSPSQPPAHFWAPPEGTTGPRRWRGPHDNSGDRGQDRATLTQHVLALSLLSVDGTNSLHLLLFFFSLPWKSKSGSWVGREPAKMNSNEPISIEIGSLPCQRLIKPNALNSLQQTRCWRQCPPSCLQEITHHFKIKRMKIQVGVYSCVRTSIPLQGCF